MSVPMSRFETPQTNHNVLISPPRDPENNSTVTGPALANCAKFTGGAAMVTAHPRYSLFCQGIRAIHEDKGGGMLSGLGTGFGILAIMASPLYLILRVGIGVPVTAGGIIATMATSTAYLAEVIARKAALIFKPSLATEQRIQLTTEFVKRMVNMADKLAYNERRQLLVDNPALLVNLAAICVAFLSRDADVNCIKAGDNLLSRGQLNVDEVRKEYFDSILEMKVMIKSLQLSSDNDHAWMTLVNYLGNLENDLPADASVHERNRQETCRILANTAMELSARVTEDAVFMDIWNHRDDINMN